MTINRASRLRIHLEGLEGIHMEFSEGEENTDVTREEEREESDHNNSSESECNFENE